MKIESRKLRDSARGERCTLEYPNCCNHDPATTVLCHLRGLGGGGMGLKPTDIAAVYACSACHDALDGRVKCVSASEYWYVARALVRTHARMIEQGAIKVPAR